MGSLASADPAIAMFHLLSTVTQGLTLEVWVFASPADRQSSSDGLRVLATEKRPLTVADLTFPDSIEAPEHFALVVRDEAEPFAVAHIDWDSDQEAFVLVAHTATLAPPDAIGTLSAIPSAPTLEFRPDRSRRVVCLTGDGHQLGVSHADRLQSLLGGPCRTGEANEVVWLDASREGESVTISRRARFKTRRTTSSNWTSDWFKPPTEVDEITDDAAHPLARWFDTLTRVGRNRPGAVVLATIIADGDSLGPLLFHDTTRYPVERPIDISRYATSGRDIARSFADDGIVELRHSGRVDAAVLDTVARAEALARALARRREMLARLYRFFEGAIAELDADHRGDSVVTQLNKSMMEPFPHGVGGAVLAPDAIWTNPHPLERFVELVELAVGADEITERDLDAFIQELEAPDEITLRMEELLLEMDRHVALTEGRTPLPDGTTLVERLAPALALHSEESLARAMRQMHAEFPPVYAPPIGASADDHGTITPDRVGLAWEVRNGARFDPETWLVTPSTSGEGSIAELCNSHVPLLDQRVRATIDSMSGGTFASTEELELAKGKWRLALEEFDLSEIRLPHYAGLDDGRKSRRMVSAAAATALNTMFDAMARSCAGFGFTATPTSPGSAFRDFDRQHELFGNESNEEKALQDVAAPGTSRHHYGSDFDPFIVSDDWNSALMEDRGRLEDRVERKANKRDRKGSFAVGYFWAARYGAYFGFVQPFSESRFRRTRTPELSLDGADPTHFTRGYILERWHWSYWPIAQAIIEDIALHVDAMSSVLHDSWKNDDFAISESYWTDYVFNVEQRLLIEPTRFPSTGLDDVWRRWEEGR